MSKANQVVIDKLKEMRQTGTSVWVTFKGLRLRIRPERPEDLCDSAQDVLFKHRGRLHVATLSGKNRGYLFVCDSLVGGPRPLDSGVRLNHKCVLAMVEEYHARD